MSAKAAEGSGGESSPSGDDESTARADENIGGELLVPRSDLLLQGLV